MEVVLFIAVTAIVAIGGIVKELASSKKKSKVITTTAADAVVTITKIIN